MTAPVKIVRNIYALDAFAADGMPITKTINDEGYDEFVKLCMGLLGPSHKPQFTIKERWVSNPRSKWPPILYKGLLFLLSAKVKSVLEEYDNTPLFYPVEIQDRKGEVVSSDYYYLYPRATPGGEVVRDWDKRYPRNSYFFSDAEVGNSQIFRSIFHSPPFFVTEEIKNRLAAEKFRNLEFKRYVTIEHDWNPDKDLSPYLEWVEESPLRKLKWVTKNKDWVIRHKPEWNIIK